MAEPPAMSSNPPTNRRRRPAAAMANRHGLITGATGTGKTVTLQVHRRTFFQHCRVPVFMADVKGDLCPASLPRNRRSSKKLMQRSANRPEGATPRQPVAFWDVFGEQGHPVRATISDMGPILLARLLNLNDTQAGVLRWYSRSPTTTASAARPQGPARDGAVRRREREDLHHRVRQHLGGVDRRHPARPADAGRAGRRRLLRRADARHQRPDADRRRPWRHQRAGRRQAGSTPALYSTFLLWLLSELFEQLPEVGDMDEPKMVFFFDEAHLLFSDAPGADRRSSRSSA